MLFSPGDARLPAGVQAWLVSHSLSTVVLRTADELVAVALRGRPRVVIFDAREHGDEVWGACRRLKADSFTGIVPAAVLVDDSDEAFEQAMLFGADEVLRASTPSTECVQRLDLLVRRSDRDVYVHPSTRLPGTIEIEAEIARRMAKQEAFAVCYAARS